MRTITILLLSVVVLLFAACTASAPTRGSLYPKMYDEKPVSLLVMPPINNTNHVEAKELLYTSISHPLIEAGYYVVSPHLALEMLKAESGYDAEMFMQSDAAVFGRVFGVDAVIFSVIDEWSKRGFGIDTKITYMVKSTHTNEVLFERTCDLYLSLDNSSSNSLLALAVAAINTAVTDHIEAARKANAYIFSDLPYGKYHPAFGTDRDRTANTQNISVTTH